MQHTRTLSNDESDSAEFLPGPSTRTTSKRKTSDTSLGSGDRPQRPIRFMYSGGAKTPEHRPSPSGQRILSSLSPPTPEGNLKVRTPLGPSPRRGRNPLPRGEGSLLTPEDSGENEKLEEEEGQEVEREGNLNDDQHGKDEDEGREEKDEDEERPEIPWQAEEEGESGCDADRPTSQVSSEGYDADDEGNSSRQSIPSPRQEGGTSPNDAQGSNQPSQTYVQDNEEIIWPESSEDVDQQQNHGHTSGSSNASTAAFMDEDGRVLGYVEDTTPVLTCGDWKREKGLPPSP